MSRPLKLRPRWPRSQEKAGGSERLQTLQGDLVTDDFQRVTGKAPRSIEQFAGDFGGAFGKQ